MLKLNPCLLLLLACTLLTGCNSDYLIRSTDWRSPDRFERDIQRFEKADAQSMPPRGAVLFTGSSSIRLWHDDLAEDLKPLTVLGRGFGGSNTNDLRHFADRIIIKYQPRAVVIYEGDNDIAQGIKPAAVLATYESLLDKIQDRLPNCRVYLLAVKPSIKRWHLWPKMQHVNAGLADLADDHRHITYLDIATPMLNNAGQPRPDLFAKDDLHLNPKGYDLWRNTIRPIVVQQERIYENK